MSPWVSKEASSHEQEHDLGTFLSEKERIELNLLITKISESMRKKISDAFDAYATEPRKPVTNPYTSQGAPHKETDEEEKARKIREHRIKEISDSKQQELKISALNHLHEWSASVIKRVTESIGQALNKDKKPPPGVEGGNITADTNPTKNTDTTMDTKTTEEILVEEFDSLSIQYYPPISTTLYSLPVPSRTLLLQTMLLLLLSLGHYTAPSRILLLNIASSLHVPFHVLAALEIETAKGLVEGAADAGEDEITKQRHAKERASRRWKLILAAAAGVAVIGVSGGLLAPEVAAGLATVVAGWGLEATLAADLLGTLAESQVIVGAIFGAYGGLASYKMMAEYAKEVKDFNLIPIASHHTHTTESTGAHLMRHITHAPAPSALAPVAPEDRRLRVTVGISGWLNTKEDVKNPWRVLTPSTSEIFVLRWELDALLRLSGGLKNLKSNKAWEKVTSEAVERSGLDGLEEIVWPLQALEISEKIVDNPFNVALARADMVGVVLADALGKGALGKRPVCLVGYSLGARVIYSCLQELAVRRQFDIVESVVLMGAPCPGDERFWRIMRTVVSGRLINVHSKRDLLLAVVYRVLGVQWGIAGIAEVKGVKGVENEDVSGLVSNHMQYRDLVGGILMKVGWEGVDKARAEEEDD